MIGSLVFVVGVFFWSGNRKKNNPRAYARPIAKAFLRTYEKRKVIHPDFSKQDLYLNVMIGRSGWHSEDRCLEILKSKKNLRDIASEVASQEYLEITGQTLEDRLLRNRSYFDGIAEAVNEVIPKEY